MEKKIDIFSRYEIEIETNGFATDKGQKNTLSYLFEACLEWEKFQNARKKVLIINPVTPKGLYLYGGVGRGKTFLMDLFYSTVTVEKKLRIHFHEFMQSIENKLNEISGSKEPMKKISQNLSKKYNLICFDEFYVQDIAHAMIFESLFKYLNFYNVSFVLTSNFHPDELYKDGLQRESFLPAINLLKTIMEIVKIPDGPDHRTDRDIITIENLDKNSLKKNARYLYPHNNDCQIRLQRHFNSRVNGRVQSADYLTVSNRKINIIAMAGTVCWFKFEALCSSFRSKREYLELSEIFQTFIVERIPSLTKDNLSAATRFGWFIDVLYDRGLSLVLSSSVPLANLFAEDILTIEFQRIKSRLYELTQ